MKSIKIALFVSFVILASFLIQPVTCAAYQLGWAIIQQIEKEESGDSRNRLYFNVLDDSGNYVSNADVVTNVVLKGPSANPVNLSTLTFHPHHDIYFSRFDIVNYSWIYDAPFPASGFDFTILDSLVTGTYTLEVSLENGQKFTESINFDFLLKLPIIPSCTFQIHTDLDGNLHWTWDIPAQLLTLSKTFDLQTRAGVGAYVNEQWVAYSLTSVPVEMGSIFVPDSIYKNVVSGAEKIRFYIMVHNSNHSARTYSNDIWVQDLSSPVSITQTQCCWKGDLDSDGDVDGDDLSLFSEYFGTMP